MGDRKMREMGHTGDTGDIYDKEECMEFDRRLYRLLADDDFGKEDRACILSMPPDKLQAITDEEEKRFAEMLDKYFGDASVQQPEKNDH